MHRANPSARVLQKKLAEYMTCLVHSREDYDKAVEASTILFGKGSASELSSIDEATLLSAMKDVPKSELSLEEFGDGMPLISIATLHNNVNSKTEARKLIKSGGFSVNKTKYDKEGDIIGKDMLIHGKYLVLLKGKKDYTLVTLK